MKRFVYLLTLLLSLQAVAQVSSDDPKSKDIMGRDATGLSGDDGGGSSPAPIGTVGSPTATFPPATTQPVVITDRQKISPPSPSPTKENTAIKSQLDGFRAALKQARSDRKAARTNYRSAMKAAKSLHADAKSSAEQKAKDQLKADLAKVKEEFKAARALKKEPSTVAAVAAAKATVQSSSDEAKRANANDLSRVSQEQANKEKGEAPALTGTPAPAPVVAPSPVAAPSTGGGKFGAARN